MLILSILAFFVVIFLLASIAVTVAWMGFLKTTAEETDAARRDLETADQESPDHESYERESRLFRTERLSTLTFWDSLLTRFDFVDILEARIGQAELGWSVGRVTLAMLLSGTIVLLVLLNLVPVWGAILGGLLAAYAPYGYILRKRNRRFQKFRENFPDVLDSLARALRAGYPLSASIEMISTETLPPVSVEMRKTSAEANLGMGWPRALENLGRRMPMLEVNLFIAAVQLHARTGGRLSDVLTGLAENMREAIALQGEVRALAAHGKMTGTILSVLPVLIAGMMLWVSPGYMQILFNHPYGKTLITAAVACLVIAHFVIRKIVDIQV